MITTTRSMVRHWHSLALVLTAASALCASQTVGAGETITFFHNDVAGSPAVATDVNGIQAWKETYRPYGDQLIDSSAAQNNKLWFTGKPFDDSTGLSYMGARYYDPTLGRFMAVDPASFNLDNLHSFNRYTYANNNPYKFVDPDGEVPVLAAIPVAIRGLIVLTVACAAIEPCHNWRPLITPLQPPPSLWSEKHEVKSGSVPQVDKSGIAATPPDPDDDGSGGSDGQNLKYESTPKHEKGGWGTLMDLDAKTAQRALNNSIESGRSRYALNDGQPYMFKSNNAGAWHGYPVSGNKVPTPVLREFMRRGQLTRREYNRLVRGK